MKVGEYYLWMKQIPAPSLGYSPLSKQVIKKKVIKGKIVKKKVIKIKAVNLKILSGKRMTSSILSARSIGFL